MQSLRDDLALLMKYNVPVPRYTSYPAVPYWSDSFGSGQWKETFVRQFGQYPSPGLAIYIHLPFCESLCSFCGCTRTITRNHAVEKPYVSAVLQEWRLYRNLMDRTPLVRELHLGGGTPTFFSPANLEHLVEGILGQGQTRPDAAFSFEGHPNNTTWEHLATLRQLGFTRVSFGIQDLDPRVQRAISREQPFERVERVTAEARDLGYRSVNFDLVYGLPFQTMATLENTIRQCLRLKPDRIAFYSYAHVPWTSRGQRLYDEKDLPGPEEKMALYRLGRMLFAEAGYADIGMDHFALPHDSLFQAREQGTLHRNFMGYTHRHADLLVGLGVSAISDIGVAYAQNSKSRHDYEAILATGCLPVVRGALLQAEDLYIKQHILDLSCRGYTRISPWMPESLKAAILERLRPMEADGLVDIGQETVRVTSKGRIFVRNICSAFDLYLHGNADHTGPPRFSSAV